MKKFKLVLMLALCALFFSGNVFAEVLSSDGGSDGVLSLATGYEIALSPNVTASYTVGVNAAGAANQWWVAGTYHEGGTLTYGTAANITKIYSMENDGDDQIDQLPPTLNSESDWSDNGWEL
jgi:hypothetical protein